MLTKGVSSTRFRLTLCDVRAILHPKRKDPSAYLCESTTAYWQSTETTDDGKYRPLLWLVAITGIGQGMASHTSHKKISLRAGRIAVVLVAAGCLLAGHALYGDISPVASHAPLPNPAAVVLSLGRTSGSVLAGQSGAAGPFLVADGHSSFDPHLLGHRLLGQHASPLLPESVGESRDCSAKPQVRELPPPPGSMTIALSGLLTLGGLRLVRQAKHIDLASLPEWYHSGAPDRVGQAIRLDLSIDRSLVPVCWYEPLAVASDALEPAFHERQPEERSCWQSAYFIPTIAPRSPPAVA